jgi:L-fucose isomerase-like protein
MDQLTAGYVSLGTEFYVPERLRAITADAEMQLRAAGIDLVRTDPVFALGQEDRAIRELRAQPWDFLIVNVINWIDPRAATRILYEFRGEPVVLYSKGGFTEGDTLISPAAGAGSTALRYPMERWGMKFTYLFNGHDQPMDVQGILKFGRAARAMKKLRGARVGILGFNDMGLYTTGFNVTTLRGAIGVEVESFDMLQLERRMNAIEDKVVKDEAARISADWEYPLGKPPVETIEKSIRLYLATVEICREKNFSAVSYKCVEGLPAHMGVVHSVPSALVATAGYPYVDEDDVGTMVAELMLKYISGETPTFIEHYEHHPEWILLGVDGFLPMQLMRGKPMVKSISTVLLQGLVFCSKMKTGRMTLACLSEDLPSAGSSAYRMHIATGEGKEPPQWVEMGVPLPSWPSVKFIPDSTVRSILNHVQSQHFAAVFGDYGDEMVELCRLMDIRVIADR